MVRGLEVDGRKVEGLRTEMPFHISIPVEFESVTRGKWTPDGEEVLISLDSTRVELSGIIDLVLCATSDDGAPAIRAIDLKTTDASSLLGDWESGLLDSLGDDSIGPLSGRGIPATQAQAADGSLPSSIGRVGVGQGA